MELTLSIQSKGLIAVTCNGQLSHTFQLVSLIPQENSKGSPPHPLEDPVSYGQAIYQALFLEDSKAQQALDSGPTRIFLVTENEELQAIPWEYAHNGNDFLVLEFTFVRGLSENQRISAPDLKETPVHIVGVPSNPLDEDIITLKMAAFARYCS